MALQPSTDVIAGPYGYVIASPDNPDIDERYTEPTSLTPTVVDERKSTSSSRRSAASGEPSVTTLAHQLEPEAVVEQKATPSAGKRNPPPADHVSSLLGDHPPASDHVTRGHAAATSKSHSVETPASSAYPMSMPTTDFRAPVPSRKSSSNVTTSSGRRLKTRGERTRARELSLDRMAQRGVPSVAVGGRRTSNAADENDSTTPPKNSSTASVDHQRLPATSGGPLDDEAGSRRRAAVQEHVAVNNENSDFLDMVQLPLPGSPRLLSARRDLFDDAVLREIDITRRQREASTGFTSDRATAAAALPVGTGRSMSVSTSSWNTTPSPIVAAATDRRQLQQPSSGDDDELFARWIHKSSPMTSSPADLDHPYVVAEISRSSPTKGRTTSLVGEGTRTSVVASNRQETAAKSRATPSASHVTHVAVADSLAARSVFVDLTTGNRLALPPPPPPPPPKQPPTAQSRNPSMVDAGYHPSAAKEDASHSMDPLMRTKNRLKFIVAVPKSSLRNMTSDWSDDANDQPSEVNVTSRLAIVAN